MDIPREPKSKRRRWIVGGAAVVGIVIVTAALGRLEPAAPSVDRGTLWIDTVRKGEMVRQVRGPGTLVPEQILYLSAVTGGRVEKIHVRPGEKVTANTLILEMSNPDVQLEALSAEQQLSAAEAALVSLKTTLETQRLNQEGTVATTQQQYNEAKRNADVANGLDTKGLLSPVEVGNARDRATEAQKRLEVETQRLAVMSKSIDEQLALQQQQVARLRAIADFQRKRVESMQLHAGADGVLQDMDLQPGQWVQPGTLLAKVAQPGRLKAVLQIPETQAKDVALGQPAAIDTRNGIVKGHVVRMDPSAHNGTVTVDVALDGALPPGARPDLSVDGTIEVERLKDVLYVGRPAYGQAESTVGLFKLTPDGKEAVRVNVKLGRSSVNTIEVVQGLNVNDKVIISDMSAWDSHDRVRLR
ncbi:MAG TPA: HlyD family efflux transporter periplasmic adaptor subunit [Gemmatimonadaceae bacterium]|nr:HlyD family efflux transporter periplasmic adaptor subunit [Gemmatimonadaceae bacterium]